LAIVGENGCKNEEGYHLDDPLLYVQLWQENIF